ncbi:MAG: hypothetical protein IJX20_00345 [Alphaproteobacteria bacterium]|nr:hypothetical protein [Alphaproteobacteria bacterium]
MDNDYIATLNNEEKIIFIKLFCKMIKADGVIDTAELDFLNIITRRFGVEKAIVVDIVKTVSKIDYIVEAQKITNRQHALELIKELCVLANIDQSMDDTELNIIADIAEAMNIEEQKVIAINRFVLDSLILNKVGQHILEKSNG